MRSQTKWGYLFILPMSALLVIFLLGPIIAAFFMSFTNYSIGIPVKWVGLHNYQKFLQDRTFLTSIFNTTYFCFTIVPLGTALSLALALLINQKIKGITFFRTIFFTPVVMSIVVCGLLWMWIYDPYFGLLNNLLEKVGFPAPRWLKDPQWAKPSIVLMTLWRSAGWEMLIFLAGLQGIPRVYYEAAEVDGANKFHCFWHITFPQLRPVTLFIVVMYCIWAFQIFTEIYVMTQGGPLNSTTTMVHQIYTHAFRSFQLGYATAMSFVLALIIFGLTVLNLKVFREK